MSNEYVCTGLYGKAVTVKLPLGFIDVSKLRQVPDNQEVYVKETGLTSIIFDITERVDESDVVEAIKYHLEDVAEKGNIIKVWANSVVNMAKFPSGTPAITLFATIHPSHTTTSNFTALIMTLIRLERQKTDVVVTVNIPHLVGEYDQGAINLEEGIPGALIKEGMTMRDQVLQSLEVHDWNLFNGD